LRTLAFFDRTNIIHIPNSVSRRLNILCTMLRMIAFFIITMFSRLYVKIVIFLAGGKHLHFTKTGGLGQHN
jgi:hypothetical protein